MSKKTKRLDTFGDKYLQAIKPITSQGALKSETREQIVSLTKYPPMNYGMSFKLPTSKLTKAMKKQPCLPSSKTPASYGYLESPAPVRLSRTNGLRDTYIVSGMERCGTSMAVRCCYYGMPNVPVRMNSPKAHAIIDGYDPNPKGYWELKSFSKMGPDWYKSISGSLVKIMSRHIPKLGPVREGTRYKVLWVTRDFQEMNASRVKCGKIPLREDDVEILLERNIGILKMRKDVDLVIVDHHDFFTRPEWIIAKLVDAGWPLTAKDKFISQIYPELYRNRNVDKFNDRLGDSGTPL